MHGIAKFLPVRREFLMIPGQQGDPYSPSRRSNFVVIILLPMVSWKDEGSRKVWLVLLRHVQKLYRLLHTITYTCRRTSTALKAPLFHHRDRGNQDTQRCVR